MGLSALSIAGIVVIMVGMIVFLVFLTLFLGKRAFISNFGKNTKTADAEVVRFADMSNPYRLNNPHPANPIIAYHNEFKDRDEEEELIGTGIANIDELPEKKKNMGVSEGDKIKIEYISWKARVIDPRFVDVRQYRLSRYMLPMVVSAVVILAGFFILIVGIGLF